jgi:predicted component of type VI protein secretion system
LLRDESLSLSLNQPVSISAREGRITIEINLVRLQKSSPELIIRVVREEKEILKTQVRLSPGRTVLIGGPKLREGVIIYALSAQL